MVTASTRAERPLRILFSMRNFWYVKLFDSVIKELAARGHHVHILAERGEHNEVARDWNDAAAALAREYPEVTFDWAPLQIEDDWVDLRMMIRLSIDHLRFLQDEYAGAPILGERARRRAPETIVRLFDRPLLRGRTARRLVGSILRAAERALPADADVAAYVASCPADVILITPMLTLGSEQIDVLRAARRRGVPTALCVGSWDHLSSKALIRETPDRVFVWNETQRDEAVVLHHVPSERVVVTGAQCFDQWFDRAPALDRRAFCAKVGLDAGRPYVLYVCSALFEGSPSEAEFVRSWIAALRSSGDPQLETVGVLVRPHPKRSFEWDTVNLSGLHDVTLWPPRAAAPFDAATKADYFDSMYHGAATVGLNTSALIEAGIIGRPVHTILLPEFYDNQEGTLHFRYLLDGGLLRAARDMPSHLEALAASLRTSDPSVHHNLGFIERFVRPHGLHANATAAFADAVVALAGTATVPVPDPVWVPAVRAALTPVMRKTQGTFADKIGRMRRQREKNRAREERVAALHAERATRKARVAEERQRRREEKASGHRDRVTAARAAKIRAKEQRLAAKRAAKSRPGVGGVIRSYLGRVAARFSPSR